MFEQQDIVDMFGPASHAGGWQQYQEGDWLRIVDDGLTVPVGQTRAHYHGTTLSSIRPIRLQGFETSEPAHGCGRGIWGITMAAVEGHDVGHALERTKLRKGWLEHDQYLNGWTAPVVIGMKPPIEELKLHHAIGCPPCRVQLWKREARVVTVWGMPFEVYLHLPSFLRFRELPENYASLNASTHVLCCSRLGQPEAALDCPRVTCGKTCKFEDLHAEGWHRAKESKLWFCKQCHRTRLLRNQPWTTVVTG